MKTLEEIIENVGKENGFSFDNWKASLPVDLWREIAKRYANEKANAVLHRAGKQITDLHSESKKLERKEGSTGFIEFGKTNAYRNCLIILNSLQTKE